MNGLKWSVLPTCLFLGACATTQAPQIVKVAVPVRCEAEIAPEPSLYTAELPNPLGDDQLDLFVAAATADIELLQGYSGQLRAALKSCK